MRAAVAAGPDGDARNGEPDRFLGQEHQGGSALLGGTDRDEEGDGDLLGVLHAGDQADDGLLRHGSLLCV